MKPKYIATVINDKRDPECGGGYQEHHSGCPNADADELAED